MKMEFNLAADKTILYLDKVETIQLYDIIRDYIRNKRQSLLLQDNFAEELRKYLASAVIK